MNGHLLVWVFIGTVSTVHGACDPTACASKVADFTTATKAADICKFAQAYIDCQTVVMRDCGITDMSALGVYRTALTTNNCDAVGPDLSGKLTCDRNACTSKATDFGKAVTVDDICKYAKAYIDCQSVVIEACSLDSSTLKTYQTALSSNNCNSGAALRFTLACLVLTALLSLISR